MKNKTSKHPSRQAGIWKCRKNKAEVSTFIGAVVKSIAVLEGSKVQKDKHLPFLNIPILSNCRKNTSPPKAIFFSRKGISSAKKNCLSKMREQAKFFKKQKANTIQEKQN
ncbi:MAG: hypothetical protein IPH94_20080 [Saprospiraceae bacterium]|nr:hypothetical protein [Saprospiraceae bacterium]